MISKLDSKLVSLFSDTIEDDDPDGLILSFLPLIAPRFSNKPSELQTFHNSKNGGIMCLPEDILTKIFLHFHRNFNLQNIGLVCRRFLEVVRQPIFVPRQTISSLTEGDKNRVICKTSIAEIRNVLKIYPECKLELSFSRGHEMGDDDYFEGNSPMISFKKLEPYLTSISKLDFSISDSMFSLSRNLNFIPSLVNLKCLEMDFSDHNYETRFNDEFGGVYSIEDAFWDKFPNLTTLNIGVDPIDERVNMITIYVQIGFSTKSNNSSVCNCSHQLISLIKFVPNARS